MVRWPVPESYSTRVPPPSSPGSFWEDRGDRHHCGVDIYAPCNSLVVAAESGKVEYIGPFTSPEWIPYWNPTSSVICSLRGGYFIRYAELGEVWVECGDQISCGEPIGRLGPVLNFSLIEDESPAYIRTLKDRGHQCMLHVEMYRTMPDNDPHYLGGNWFGAGKPQGLLDPSLLLDHCWE